MKRKKLPPGTMLVGRRIALRPTKKQREALAQSAGCGRAAWNWGLTRKKESWALRKAALEAGVPKEDAPKVPSAIDLHAELVILKDLPEEQGGMPWMRLVTKCAPQEALRDLDKAYVAAFERCKAGKKPGFPRYKKKILGEGHYRVTGTSSRKVSDGVYERIGNIKVDEKTVQIPNIGKVRIKPGDRGYAQSGSYEAASLVQEHGEWFISVLQLIQMCPEVPADSEVVGLDLGVRKLATLSDGTIIENPRALKTHEKKLKKKQRTLSRRTKGSKRWRRAKKAVGKQHRKIRNVRKDATHKATTFVAHQYPAMAMEGIRLPNLLKKRKGRGRAAKAALNRALHDANLGEFRRQLTYKVKMLGGRLTFVNPAYTSQKCGRCGVNTDCGSNETFTCAACGFTEDRDLNAARNIRARSLERPGVPASCTETINARGGEVSRQSQLTLALTPMKREPDAEEQAHV